MKKLIIYVLLVLLIITLFCASCKGSSEGLKSVESVHSDSSSSGAEDIGKAEITLPQQRFCMAQGWNNGEDCNYCFYVTEDGDLWRWIDNTKDYELIDTNVKAITPAGSGEFITELKKDGTVFGEGQNNCGQLGVPVKEEVLKAGICDDYRVGQLLSENEKKSEQIIQDVKMISAGLEHTIVLKHDNTVWSWGENADGQMGNGYPENGKRSRMGKWFENKPVKVLSDGIFVAAGNSHSAAITSNYDLYVWGDNSCGEIGNGEHGNGFPTASNRVVSTPYLALKNVKWVRLLGTATYAITTDNALWAWGSGQNDIPTKIASDIADVIGYGKAIYVSDTGGKVYPLQDMFNLISENVSAFDSYQLQLFADKKLDGSLVVYSYDSLLGFSADSPGSILALKDSDFKKLN